MAKLSFRYGTMGSSKTANALMTRHRLTERGKNPLLLKPDMENRDGERKIRSRIGLEAECVLWSEFLEQYRRGEIAGYDAVIVDEAQFLSETDVEILADLADGRDIPVLCYGLRTDFSSRLFPGSRRLVELADEMVELESVCWCGKRAIMTARVDEKGEVVRQGDVVLLGGDGRYVPLCREHYREGMTGPAPAGEKKAARAKEKEKEP